MVVKAISALVAHHAAFLGTVHGNAASAKALLKQVPLICQEALPGAQDGFEPHRDFAGEIGKGQHFHIVWYVGQVCNTF